MKTDCGENAISVWRKQLRFRAWHRGTREADLIMGRFADETLPNLDAAGLKQFEDLLQCADPDVYDWMTGRSDPPNEHNTPLLRRLKEFKISRAD